MRGVYLLVIKIDKNLQLKIGSLGKINFDKGVYVYVGSAQNNLEKRIQRHRLKNKKLRWHIDYLLKNKFVKILKTFYKESGKLEECKIARKLSKTEFLIPNFGCSDCQCKSHLFKIRNLDIVELGVKKL